MRFIRLFMIVGLLVMVISGCGGGGSSSPSAPSTTITLSGKVTEGLSGISGTTVTVQDNNNTFTKTTSTDSSGNYSVTVPTQGTYTITVAKDRYLYSPQSSTITTSSNSNTQDFTGTTPTILASALFEPRGIAIDAYDVYWNDNRGNYNGYTSTGGLKKVTLSGGGVVSLGVNGWPLMTSDTSNLYFVDPSSSQITKVNKSNGVKTVLLAGGAGRIAYDIAVDSNNVYWYETGQLNKMSINGGTITTLATGSSYSNGIAIDDSYVYWIDYATGGTGALKKIGINGGPVTTLTTITYAPSTSRAVAVDSNYVYWVAQTYSIGSTAKTNISKISKDGGTVTVLTNADVGGANIVVDSSYVYWGGINLYKIGTSGGTVTVLSSVAPSSIAVDSTSVYWTSGGYDILPGSSPPLDIGKGYLNKIAK